MPEYTTAVPAVAAPTERRYDSLVRPPLRSLSDEQMVDAGDLFPSEARLKAFAFSGVGCLASAGTAVVAVAAGHVLLACGWARDWPLLVVAGLVLATVMTLGLDARAERRRRPYWRELNRRFAGATVDV